MSRPDMAACRPDNTKLKQIDCSPETKLGMPRSSAVYESFNGLKRPGHGVVSRVRPRPPRDGARRGKKARQAMDREHIPYVVIPNASIVKEDTLLYIGKRTLIGYGALSFIVFALVHESALLAFGITQEPKKISILYFVVFWLVFVFCFLFC